MGFLELDEKPVSWFIWYSTLLVGLGSFLDGYDLLNVSIALPFISKTMIISASMQGLLGTATYLGGIVGAIIFGVFSDLRGRKVALVIDLVFFMLASLLSAVITTPAQLLALRAAIGFGIGADIVSGPALLSELLPKKSRGALLGTSLLMMPLGGLVSVVIAYILYSSGISAPLLWRIIFALGAVPALLVIILRNWLPESPRWLIKFRNTKKFARETKALNLTAQEAAKHDYSTLLTKYRKALLYSSVAWLSAGTTSIFTIFTPMILQKFASKAYPQLISITAIIWVAATCGAAVALLLHDKAGRRGILIASMVMLGISDLMLGLSFTGNGAIVEMVLAGAMFFSFMNISAAYVIQTEVFPTEIKSVANGISFTINRIANFAFGMFVPVFLLLGELKPFMWLTGAIIIAMALVALLTGIETMGKSLEKIQQEVAY
jgi:putative MFS transporter